jgi:APA family basic amino acid/polyamine antiporter
MRWNFHLPMIGTVYPLKELPVKLLTVALILLFTWINRRSVQWGGGIQRWLTAIKLTAIVSLIVGILFSGKGQYNHLSSVLPDAPEGWMIFPAFMAAMAGAFWAYDGWNNITFIAGEIREPQRTIPRSLAAGLSICMIVYLVMNLSYIISLPPQKMSSSEFIAADAAASVWGMAGAALIVLMVVASTLGTANANVLATARVTFAMGRESRWFSAAGKVHPRFKTPANALMLNAVWSCLLVFSGSFDALTDMLIFVSWFFYGMSALGLFVLRYKMPHAERPYKVAGYPFVPGIFLLFTCFFLGTTFYHDVVQYYQGKIPMMHSVMGLVITVAGLPVYYFSSRIKKQISSR